MKTFLPAPSTSVSARDKVSDGAKGGMIKHQGVPQLQGVDRTARTGWSRLIPHRNPRLCQRCCFSAAQTARTWTFAPMERLKGLSDSTQRLISIPIGRLLQPSCGNLMPAPASAVKRFRNSTEDKESWQRSPWPWGKKCQDLKKRHLSVTWGLSYPLLGRAETSLFKYSWVIFPKHWHCPLLELQRVNHSKK